MSVHEKVKMQQESYHPGQAILEWYVPVWNLSVYRMADSCMIS